MHVRLENTMPIKKTEGGGRCQGRSGGSEACKLDVCTDKGVENIIRNTVVGTWLNMVQLGKIICLFERKVMPL